MCLNQGFDRTAVAAMSGCGMLCFGACYDVTIPEMMANELNSAIKHTRLNGWDLRTTLNLSEGATPAAKLLCSRAIWACRQLYLPGKEIALARYLELRQRRLPGSRSLIKWDY